MPEKDAKRLAQPVGMLPLGAAQFAATTELACNCCSCVTKKRVFPYICGVNLLVECLTIRVCGRALGKNRNANSPVFFVTADIGKKLCFISVDYGHKCNRYILYFQEKNAVFIFFFLIIRQLCN